MTSIDLNCDLGEGCGADHVLIPLVSSVNIACGGHAGDDRTMRDAVRVARAAGVNIGAHPGFEDPANFGRVEIACSSDQIHSLITRQVSRLRAIALAEGAALGHVKPHGALYHVVNRDSSAARAVIEAIGAIDASLAVVTPAGSALESAAIAAGLRPVAEAFADRTYQPDGTLTPRTQPNAIIHDPDAAATQAIEIIRHQRATTIDGCTIEVRAQTLCVHGDGQQAVPILTHLRNRLAEVGINVCPF
jgi:UPF0271 protein